MFKIIVAFDKNRTIGYEGWMPWELPEDLKHFRETTLNHKLIMGSTTFYGMKKPLPNRITYVLSSKRVEESDHVKWIKNLDDFINEHKDSDEVFYVCGGASIYEQFLDVSNEMIVSFVEGEHPSDTKFPKFNEEDFEITDLKKYTSFMVKSYKRK